MIDIWVCDIRNISEEWLKERVGLLPKALQEDILRYNLLNDRKSKLLGRLIVERFHVDNNIDFSYHNWCLSEHKKPFIRGGCHFNISHSGNLVVVAFSNASVGIDIEAEKNVEMESLISYFHPDEVEHFRNSEDQLSEFYFLWTRKEALLKAIGIGLLDGLDKRNCLISPVKEEHQWYLKSIQLPEKYHLAICSPFEIDELSIKHVDLDFGNASICP